MAGKRMLFKEAAKFNKEVFESKRRMRKVWAKQPMEAKIRELVKLQEITATLHPELRRLIPWKLSD